MLITQEINVDFADKYPSILTLKSSELNAYSIRLLVNLYNNKEPINFSEGDRVTAAIVTEGVLITDNRECEVVGENQFLVSLCKEDDNITILPGKMLIEITVTSTDGSVFVLPVVFAVRVGNSIINNAKIIDSSYGTVAECLTQIYESIRGYNTLTERFEANEAQIDILTKASTLKISEISEFFSTGYIWYIGSAGVFVKSPTSSNVVSTTDSIKLNSGAAIKANDGYEFRVYIANDDGTPSSIQTPNAWVTSYTLSSDSNVILSFRNTSSNSGVSIDDIKNNVYIENVTVGNIAENVINFALENIQSSTETKSDNCVLYLMDNGNAAWTNGDTTTLTLSGDIMFRINKNNYRVYASDILAAAQETSDLVTVSDNKITGNAFAIYYNTDTNTVGVCATSEYSLITKYPVIFHHHFASDTSGLLVEHMNRKRFELSLNDTATAMKNKSDNCVVYLANGGSITWTNESNTTLSINANVVMRIKNRNKTITVDDILTAAQNASGIVTVADGKISGSAFAIYYNTDTESVVVCDTNSNQALTQYPVLFFHQYTSDTSGLLVDYQQGKKILTLESDVEIMKNMQKHSLSDYSEIFGTNKTWYINNGIIDRNITNEKAVSSFGLVKLNKGATISVNYGYMFRLYFAEADGTLITTTNPSTYYFNDYTAENDEYAYINFWARQSIYPNATSADTLENCFIIGLTPKNSNAAFLDKIDELHEEFENYSERDNLPSFFESELADTVSKLETYCTEPSLVIGFVTDSHMTQNNSDYFNDTAKAVCAVNNSYPMDVVIHGGDITDGVKSVSETKSLMRTVRNDLIDSCGNVFFVAGNHDDNSFSYNETYGSDNPGIISNPARYALLERQNAAKVVFGEDGACYYYYDVDKLGIRIIVLDMFLGEGQNYYGDGGSAGYTNNQLAWVRDTALNTNNQVIFFSHMPCTQAYNAYNSSIQNGAEMRTVINNFKSNGGTVIGFFHGHTHWDYMNKYTENGFYEISTGAERFTARDNDDYSNFSYIPQGATVARRASGTATQTLWDVIIVRPKSQTVKIVRFGGGSDREFSY